MEARSVQARSVQARSVQVIQVQAQSPQIISSPELMFAARAWVGTAQAAEEVSSKLRGGPSSREKTRGGS